MTGKLEVRLSQYLLGPSAVRGAVATVYPLDKGAEASRQSLVIPAGAESPATVEVAAGRYLVEAMLPSGETVGQEVEVVEGGSMSVDLEGTSSEHEWLSWQRLVGNVGRGAQAAPREAQGSVEGALSEDLEDATADALPPAPPTAGAEPRAAEAPMAHWIADPADPLRGDGSSTDAWELIAKTLNASGTDVLRRLAPRGALRLQPGDGDLDHQLYRLRGDGAATSSDPLSDRGSPTPRRYLLIESPEWTELVCAPVPWYNEANSEQSVIEVLVRTAPAHGEAAAATTLRDPQFGSALSYMTIGALPEARQIYDQARDILFGKVVNPLAAAGGGYVLLATDTPGDAADWPDWIENLRTWFPWLPDGAIQAGWLKLKRRRDASDVDGARAAFHEAVSRGLPFYSIGLQRLVEGLTMFEGETETDRLLAQVRSVTWHANLQQPFTTLRLRG